MATVSTPLGKREMNEDLQRLFQTVKTKPCEKKEQHHEYTDNGYKTVWFEKNGKMFTKLIKA